MENQRLSTYLPSEMVMDIMSRLPAQDIVRCKCVCKQWHDFLKTQNFAKLHLSKSVPGLALTVNKVMGKKTIDTNVVDMQHHNLHCPHFTTITFLDFTNHYATIHGSVGGFLLLHLLTRKRKLQIHLCNPVTREYIDLHYVQPGKLGINIFGFGVSKISGQYKVVAIFQDQTKRTAEGLPVSESECKVYTVGTGSWRSIAPNALLRYSLSYGGVFVNGNLHWMAHDINGTPWVSCFDLETELFTTFRPPLQSGNAVVFSLLLVAVEGSLCICDYTSDRGMISIWRMKEYGDEKFWTKEFVIKKIPTFAYPVKFTKDGVILLVRNSTSVFFYYSGPGQSKTSHKICSSGGCFYATSYSHTPSFLSLGCFGMENSISF